MKKRARKQENPHTPESERKQGKKYREEKKSQETQKEKLEERFAKQQLVALDLDDKILQILHDNNVISVGDLATKVESDKDSLLAFKGFGPKSMEQVETKLAEAKEAYFTEA